MEKIEQKPIGIGHNDPEGPSLKVRLETNYTDLKKRAAELLEAFGRAPSDIKDDATQGKVGDLYRLMATCTSKVESTRKEEKEPFVLDGRVVDSFFKEISEPVERAMAALKGRATLYSNAKIQAERKRLADEEAARRAEATRALEAAQKAADAGKDKAADKQLAKAEQATAAADQAHAASSAAPAEIARTRGEHATVTTQTRWVHEVQDWHALMSSLGILGAYLGRDDVEKAVRVCVRQNHDAVAIPGVRIFQSTASSFR